VSKTASAAASRLGVNIPGVFTAAGQGRALIAKKLAEDGVSPNQLRAMVTEARNSGQPIVFADLLVEAKAHRTLALLDDAVRTRDPNLQSTLENLQRMLSRQTESGGRTIGFLAERLFRNQKVGTMALGDVQDALMTRARTTSQPLYAKAHGAVANIGNDLRQLLAGKGGFHKEWRTAYERARSRFKSEQFTGGGDPFVGDVPPLNQFLQSGKEVLAAQLRKQGIPESRIPEMLARSGAKEGTDQLPVKFLDYLKQEIDEIVEPVRVSLAGAETQGASRAGKRQIEAELAKFVKAVDDQVPVYAEARAAFAGDVSMAKAGDLGRKAYGSRITNDQVVRGMDALKTVGEKNLYRLGWLQGLADDISRSSGKAIDFSSRFFGGNPTGIANNRIETIRRLFPRAQDADEVIAFIHREARMYEVLQRSGRRPSQALQETVDEISGATPLPRGITGGASMTPGRQPGVFVRVLSAGINRAKLPFVREVSDEISSLFLKGASTLEELDALIAHLIGPGSRQLQRQTLLGAAGRLTAGQQAEQFAENPLVPVVAGVEATAQGLGALLGRVR
jgi:hypothetical protein